MSTTLSRLLDSVFSGTKFVPQHTGIEENEIFEVLARLPFSLSKSTSISKKAVCSFGGSACK